MSHTGTENESTERVALYALGALGQHEAQAFDEHLAEGCAECARELEGFKRVVSSLALGAVAVPPPTEAREKLLNRIAEKDPSAKRGDALLPEGAREFLIVRAGEGDWIKTHDEGVFVKVLFVDKERDTVTTLVRMEPGARIPRHRHRGVEQCLILEGDVRSGGHVMGAGDFNCSFQGSIHDELQSESGALLFLVSPESYDVLPA